MTGINLISCDQMFRNTDWPVASSSWQETMMDHPLRTISYIADIGNMVVLMARGKMIRSQSAQENLDTAEMQHTNPARDDQRQYKMICHVFESEDVSVSTVNPRPPRKAANCWCLLYCLVLSLCQAQLIAQSIGQAFNVAYQEFLRANGIDPEDLSQREYSDLLNTQDMYNDDLIHFSKSENCRDVSWPVASICFLIPVASICFFQLTIISNMCVQPCKVPMVNNRC